MGRDERVAVSAAVWYGETMDLPKSARIWNRAVLENGGMDPRVGDRNLAAMMSAHNIAMNGGVFHAVEFLSAKELEAACEGYKYFGFPEVARLLQRAHRIVESGDDLGPLEQQIDSDYGSFIPSDGMLGAAFERELGEHPETFSPLSD